MQEGLAAHQPDPADIAEELPEPPQIPPVLREIGILRRHYRAVVAAGAAVEIAVVRQMQLQIDQLRLAEEVQGPPQAALGTRAARTV